MPDMNTNNYSYKYNNKTTLIFFNYNAKSLSIITINLCQISKTYKSEIINPEKHRWLKIKFPVHTGIGQLKTSLYHSLISIILDNNIQYFNS